MHFFCAPKAAALIAALIANAHTMGAAQAKARGEGEEQFTIRVRARCRVSARSSKTLTLGVYRSASVC